MGRSNEHAFLAWIDAGQILRFLQVDDTEIYVDSKGLGGEKEGEKKKPGMNILANSRGYK